MWCATGAFTGRTAASDAKQNDDRIRAILQDAIAPASVSVSMEAQDAKDELQRGQRVMTAVAERVAKARAADIRRVRERLTMLLRPVVDEDFTDDELEGLANAMMATMATLGGDDIRAIFQSEAPLPTCDLW